MKIRSMRRRLLIVLGSFIAVAWLSALLLLLNQTRYSRSNIWDNQLRAVATKIMYSIPDATELRAADADHGASNKSLEKDMSMTFQVWVDRQHLVVRAMDSPPTPLAPDFIDGPSTRMVGTDLMRVYSVSDRGGRVIVQVAEPEATLLEDVRGTMLTTLLAGTLLLAVLGWLIDGAVRRSLKPLNTIGAALRARSKFDLTPLAPTDVPAELLPLVESFNHLLGQLDQAVAAERRFIDDAAHELRTPLAALLAQAEVAMGATTMPEKDAALARLRLVAERNARLSEQLLDLARLDAGANGAHKELAQLPDLILHVAREFDVSAGCHQRVLILDTVDCEIECDIDEIGILLRNLVDNALRHARERVQIRCGPWTDDGDAVMLEVADDGAGVPLEERELIFKRFYRASGVGGRGSGIGLSLVAGIARLHGARVETCDGINGVGFGVRIIFAAPTTPAQASVVLAHAGVPARLSVAS